MMMKILLLKCLLCLCVLQGFGQTNSIIDKWFFEISFKGNTQEIQERLASNTHLLPIEQRQVTFYDSICGIIKGNRYTGQVIDTTLVKTVHADSAKVELSFGFVKNTSTRTCRGQLKSLKAQYFFSNKKDMKRTYKKAIKDLKKTTEQDIRHTFVTYIEGEKIREGTQFIYDDDPSNFHKLKVVKTRLNAKVYSVVLTQEAIIQ